MKKRKKWTKEELGDRVLVTCKAARDGLKPFIDLRQPFESFSEACRVYSDLFFKETSGDGIMLKATVIIPDKLKLDIVFWSTGEKCGEIVIEVEEVV